MGLLGPLLSFCGSVVVAIITAALTVRFALRRFYAEKWWERKSTAYASIIEALHHVRNHADTNLTFSLEGRDLPEQGKLQLTEKLQGAMAELRKQLDIGDFVLSEDAVAVMSKLMTELDESLKATNWEDHLELKLEAVDNCLISMRRIARKDLRLE
jgi:hypothetical protein